MITYEQIRQQAVDMRTNCTDGELFFMEVPQSMIGEVIALPEFLPLSDPAYIGEIAGLKVKVRK